MKFEGRIFKPNPKKVKEDGWDTFYIVSGIAISVLIYILIYIYVFRGFFGIAIPGGIIYSLIQLKINEIKKKGANRFGSLGEKLTLTTDLLTVGDRQFNVHELDNFKIYTDGYIGMSIDFFETSTTGTENFIEFSKGKTDYSFQFCINQWSDLKLLKEIGKEIKTAIQNDDSKLTLEALFQRAASGIEFRDEFYDRLLTDQLVVITQNDNQFFEGVNFLKVGDKINLARYEDGKIPIFTSKERIFDKGIIKHQVNSMLVKGRDLFEMTRGSSFVLNPYSDYGREFDPKEIENLLKGTVEKEVLIQVWQPETYPKKIVESLKELFEERQNVKAAYLGCIYNPVSGEPPHYIVGLDASGDVKSLILKARLATKDFLKSEGFVDFTEIDNKGWLSEYFTKNITPFYTR